jgi:hypothetical protein
MANPEKGEVELVIPATEEKPERRYTLKLSMNAAVTVERRLKKSLGQLVKDAANLEFDSIRCLTWLLLQKRHAKEFKTEDQAGDLIDEAGGPGPFFAAISELNRLNSPDAKAESGAGAAGAVDGAEDPTRAQG